MKTRILFAALLVPAVALAAEPLDVTKDWQALPVKAPDKADVAKVLPEKGAWTDGAALSGKIPLAEGAKGGNNLQGEFNAWYRRSVEIPKEWFAGSVRFEQQLNYCDLVVFVNGKKAGVAFHPDGAVELAPFLRAGKNEIKVFATNRSFGTGEKRIAYQGRDEALLNAPHFSGPARLVPRSAAFVEDVYAEPSWREKKLTVHVSIHAAKDRTVDLAATVSEKAGGPAVKSAERKGVKVKAGDTEVALEIPWENPVPWEPVPNAKLYACAVAMTDGGAPADAPAPVLFGFREIWREGKDILLNGHVQRFRGFWDQGFPPNAADVHRFGFNLAYRTHRHESVLAEDPVLMERLSRAGVAVFAGMPTIYYVHEAVRRDPDCEAQWRRHLRHWMRTARNWPCIVAASCGVNQICPERNMRPEILGQDPETGGVVENIEFARRAARELHPNCLYFSHADGTEADLSSSNLYFIPFPSSSNTAPPPNSATKSQPTNPPSPAPMPSPSTPRPPACSPPPSTTGASPSATSPPTPRTSPPTTSPSPSSPPKSSPTPPCGPPGPPSKAPPTTSFPSIPSPPAAPASPGTWTWSTAAIPPCIPATPPPTAPPWPGGPARSSP